MKKQQSVWGDNDHKEQDTATWSLSITYLTLKYTDYHVDSQIWQDIMKISVISSAATLIFMPVLSYKLKVNDGYTN